MHGCNKRGPSRGLIMQKASGFPFTAPFSPFCKKPSAISGRGHAFEHTVFALPALEDALPLVHKGPHVLFHDLGTQRGRSICFPIRAVQESP